MSFLKSALPTFHNQKCLHFLQKNYIQKWLKPAIRVAFSCKKAEWYDFASFLCENAALTTDFAETITKMGTNKAEP